MRRERHYTIRDREGTLASLVVGFDSDDSAGGAMGEQLADRLRELLPIAMADSGCEVVHYYGRGSCGEVEVI